MTELSTGASAGIKTGTGSRDRSRAIGIVETLLHLPRMTARMSAVVLTRFMFVVLGTAGLHLRYCTWAITFTSSFPMSSTLFKCPVEKFEHALWSGAIL
jgi:hypothetical protein